MREARREVFLFGLLASLFSSEAVYTKMMNKKLEDMDMNEVSDMLMKKGFPDEVIKSFEGNHACWWD